MIPLDSPRWRELWHAYGDAHDIPHLLRIVMDAPYLPMSSEVSQAWFDLGSALYHQSDIFPASVAAVPHLVQVALAATEGTMAPDFVEYPVLIEESRQLRPEQLRGMAIEEDYWKSLALLEESCRSSRWQDAAELRQALQLARRVLSGRPGAPLPRQSEDLGPLFT